MLIRNICFSLLGASLIVTPHILRPHRNLACGCDSRGGGNRDSDDGVRRSSRMRMRAAVAVTSSPWKRDTVLKSKFTQGREHEKEYFGSHVGN